MSDICGLESALSVAHFGGKAANLARMLKAGLPVPQGISIGINGFGDNGRVTDKVGEVVDTWLNNDKLYAVRSSALAEDAEDASWAGQFETFLDTKSQDVIAKIEECRNSAKARAKAYASDKDGNFRVAVIVQEMVKPEYAGVLFTRDPVTGAEILITEYVEGLGEELVSGRVDPKKVTLDGYNNETPFDSNELIILAKRVEELFGTPQDIEWAWAEGKMWLVQARPITTTQRSRSSYYLGEPDDLFYWGPSRANPMYMSDFMAAIQRFMLWAASSEDMPNPPKTDVLFYDGKMVWLNNAQAFFDFAEGTFMAYEKLGKLQDDTACWRTLSAQLPDLKDDELNVALVDAWYATEFAEFSLYGAEVALVKRLSRFDVDTQQEIWGSFTAPDIPTFLSQIDNELVKSQDTAAMAQKYPWIEDGYDGIAHTAEQYFNKRLLVVGNSISKQPDLKEKRTELINKLKLTDDEVSALTLARKLAEFMDERKAWMMQTRRLLTASVSNIEHGWFFDDVHAELIDENNTRELWQRYIDFKASSNAVTGIVASNGGRHFVSGEVVIVNNPTDAVKDGKIVVVPSTSPSYVPLMRNAKALVTDHGGMMSHAAIVAREFNLPCIVGTKQATKVLRDGDLVVLDLV